MIHAILLVLVFALKSWHWPYQPRNLILLVPLLNWIHSCVDNKSLNFYTKSIYVHTNCFGALSKQEFLLYWYHLVLKFDCFWIYWVRNLKEIKLREVDFIFAYSDVNIHLIYNVMSFFSCGFAELLFCHNYLVFQLFRISLC